MAKKLKFFDSEQDVIEYLTRELLDTLRDDLRNCTGRDEAETRRYLKAKIHDIESIEERLMIRPVKPQPNASRAILTAFLSALPEMDAPDEDVCGSDAVQVLSDYWPDFKAAIEQDAEREAMDTQALDDLDTLLEYNWKDEEEDYSEHEGEGKYHIFARMKRLSTWLKQQQQATKKGR